MLMTIGIHSVCVCKQHQNAKLLVAALPESFNYKDLLAEMVCDSMNRKCMLQFCSNCPGRQQLQNLLQKLFDDNDTEPEDQIEYKQWMHTDGTKVVDLKLLCNKFLDLVLEKFDLLRHHHFIDKSQSQFLQTKKEKLDNDTIIIILDFAENYSFLVQDAIQGYHWENSQATLHPFCAYYKQDGSLKCLNICMISDCMRHDTNTVHAFVTKVLHYIKTKLPSINNILYFSDGAASQYKNLKNFINLCHHKLDHGIKAEWHFFATSHDKSPCAGIGGTTKRLVARASLQATKKNQILSPKQMFQWASANISGVKFFYMDNQEVSNRTVLYQLEYRYSQCKTISGTRSHHSFVLLSKSLLLMKKISKDENGTQVVLFKENLESIFSQPRINEDCLQPGQYVACLYDNHWYIGAITQRSDINKDLYIKIMRRNQQILFWPQDLKNECWILFQDIICLISAPQLHGRSGQQYKLSNSDYQHILAMHTS